MNSQTEVNASRLNNENAVQAARSDIVALTGAVYFLTAAVLFVALLVFVSSLDMQLTADDSARNIARWIMGAIFLAGAFGGYSMWIAKRFAPSK